MVKTDSYVQFEAGKLTYRVVPVTEEIIRIIVSGKEIKEAQDSLIIEKKEYPEVDFSAEENAGNIIVKTTKVCAEINQILPILSVEVWRFQMAIKKELASCKLYFGALDCQFMSIHHGSASSVLQLLGQHMGLWYQLVLTVLLCP